MPLDDEQTEYLRALEPLPGLSEDESVALVASYVLREPFPERAEILARVEAADTTGLLSLGLRIGRFSEWRRLHGTTADLRLETHPDLAGLDTLVDDFERVPDIARLHRFTQASLLGAIQRFADAAETVDDLRVLADAYLTLPAPGEDDALPS